MAILTDFLPFVKEQAAYHDRQAIRFRSDPHKLRQHSEIAQTFRAIAAAIEHEVTKPALRVSFSPPDRPTSNGPASPSSSVLTPSDLAGLPPELLEELGISESENQDLVIVNIIDAAGGVLSLDKLLIALYRQTGEVHKRQKLTARLYRMAQKKLLYSVPKKKGFYSTKPMTRVES
jgi:hypothetical protein